MATPPWASRNTGALTTLGAGTTAHPWPATGWLTASTNPSPSKGLTTGLTRATARSWTCTSDGKMADSAGTTPATGRHIPRFRDERDRANAEQEARIQAEARAEAERDRANAEQDRGQRRAGSPHSGRSPGPGARGGDPETPATLSASNSAPALPGSAPHDGFSPAPSARNLVRNLARVPRATGERRTFPHPPRFMTSGRWSARPFGLLLTGISGCQGA